MSSPASPMVRKTKVEITVDLDSVTDRDERPRRVLADRSDSRYFVPTRMVITCWPMPSKGSPPRARVRFTAPGMRFPDTATYRIFGYPSDRPAPTWVRELVDGASMAAGMRTGVWPWDTAPVAPRTVEQRLPDQRDWDPQL